jgi:hypothetical protein
MKRNDLNNVFTELKSAVLQDRYKAVSCNPFFNAIFQIFMDIVHQVNLSVSTRPSKIFASFGGMKIV